MFLVFLEFFPVGIPEISEYGPDVVGAVVGVGPWKRLEVMVLINQCGLSIDAVFQWDAVGAVLAGGKDEVGQRQGSRDRKSVV